MNPAVERQTCPHCGQHLTVAQLLRLLYPDGFKRYVHVRLPSGEIGISDVSQLNPHTIEVLD